MTKHNGFDPGTSTQGETWDDDDWDSYRYGDDD